MYFKFNDYNRPFLNGDFKVQKNKIQLLDDLCNYYDKNCKRCIQIAGNKHIPKIDKKKKKIKRKYILIS